MQHTRGGGHWAEEHSGLQGDQITVSHRSGLEQLKCVSTLTPRLFIINSVHHGGESTGIIAQV